MAPKTGKQARVLIGYDHPKDGRHEPGEVVTISDTEYEYFSERNVVTDVLDAPAEEAQPEALGIDAPADEQPATDEVTTDEPTTEV